MKQPRAEETQETLLSQQYSIEVMPGMHRYRRDILSEMPKKSALNSRKRISIDIH